MYISLLSVLEDDKMSCFVGSFSIAAHLADVVFVLRILRVTEFSKVRKSSA